MNKIIWKQYDSRWGSKSYPSGSTMSGCGCGCVACTHVAMEQSRYAKWTPENLRPWMVKQGYALKGQGTRWEGITNTLKHIGHKTVVRIYSDPMTEAWKELNKGNRIGVILFDSSYAPNGVRWTSGGHYVAFTDYKVKNGKHYFYTKDSGGRGHDGWYTYENSMKNCIAKMWIVERVGTQTTTTTTTTKTTSTSSKLTVDGIGGKATVKAAQKKFGTTQDGVISGQKSSLKKYHSAFSGTIKYGSGGSALVKKMQKQVGVTQDGQLGQGTIKAWQKYLGTTADGYWGKGTMQAFQKWLNGDLQVKKVSTTTKTTSTTSTKSTNASTSTNSVYKVIDVSVWQGTIDWKKVKADGVVGAIIRYADGTTLDSKFATNMKNAKAAGLHIGAYIFSRAKTKSAAEAEATRLYNACKQYNPDMPLYIDMEWSSASKYANTVASAYINKMKALGGKPGIYANLTWFNKYITTKNYTAYPLWIAQYNSKITHSNPGWFGMWQYSSSGSVKGINGKVDMNKCYIAYWNQKTTKAEAEAKAKAEAEAKAKAEAEAKAKAEAEVETETKIDNTTTAVIKQSYTGQLPTTKIVKTNAEVIDDTVRWASWIAGDNSFHYGYTNSSKTINAHHNGCYFCNTNVTTGGRSKKGIVDYQKTYCCNPFVGAAWAHGGCVPAALALCRKGSSWDFSKGRGYDASSLFTKLGHPAKSKLKKGDVLCKDTHVALYIGNGKIAEASGGDDNKRNSTRWNDSIHVTTLTDTKYKTFTRVYRFNSSVNATVTIAHGEISERVLYWQKYLNWYFGQKVVSEDGIYGDVTFKYTKQFQEKEIGAGEGDGYVGPKTIEAAKKVEK